MQDQSTIVGADDVELTGRVACGDADAQRQVAGRLLRPVEGLCRTVLRSSEEALDARQLSPLARQYLDRLSERQRMVVVMRHSLEYSVEQIAEMTGISQNAVKDRLLRARGILRRMCRGEQFLVNVSSGKVAD